MSNALTRLCIIVP